MPELLSFEHPSLWAQAAAAKTASANNITKARFAGLYAILYVLSAPTVPQSTKYHKLTTKAFAEHAEKHLF